MKSLRKIILLSVLLISACQNQTVEVKKQNETVPNSNSQTSSNNPVAEEFTISPEGIGKAKLGMTLGELKQISDPDTKFKIGLVKIGPLMNDDYSTIAVSKSGVVQYYILYLAGTTSHPDKITPTDADPITILRTDNPNYQTKEGVKVGTSIKEAEAIYGDAILTYCNVSMSGEHVDFSNLMSSNIRFKPNSIESGFAGIYPDPSLEKSDTKEFHDNAKIATIEVHPL